MYCDLAAEVEEVNVYWCAVSEPTVTGPSGEEWRQRRHRRTSSRNLTNRILKRRSELNYCTI